MSLWNGAAARERLSQRLCFANKSIFTQHAVDTNESMGYMPAGHGVEFFKSRFALCKDVSFSLGQKEIRGHPERKRKLMRSMVERERRWEIGDSERQNDKHLVYGRVFKPAVSFSAGKPVPVYCIEHFVFRCERQQNLSETVTARLGGIRVLCHRVQ